jgi:hypothetical protein
MQERHTVSLKIDAKMLADDPELAVLTLDLPERDGEPLETERERMQINAMTPDDRGWLWSPSLQLWIGRWEGTYKRAPAVWLRLYDQDGRLALTSDEAAGQRAEAAQALAEAEQARAEAELARAEAEQARADAERTHAEAERARADTAEAEVACLHAELARLRGENP